MAISGSGTSTAPYVVHSYSELKEACGSDYAGFETYTKYIRLDNNINCNDRAYGDDFEWETINLTCSVGTGQIRINVDLDLGGHAIKNVMVKHDNILLKGYSKANKSKVHNGQIRNIFGNTADNAFEFVELESLSMSLNAGGFKNSVFDECQFNICATYIEAAKLNKNLICFANDTNTPYFVNSDFSFKIADANNKSIIKNSYSTKNAQVHSCRFRGEIHGTIEEGIRDMSNCVINVTCDGDNSLIHPVLGENDNVLYNSSTMACSTEYDVIAATTADMKNASTLTSKGFTVVNKSGG